MANAGIAIICGRGGCRLAYLPPIDLDDPWPQHLMQQFGSAYQKALREQRDPGKDPEVLRLLQLVVEGNGQPRLPGFEDVSGAH